MKPIYRALLGCLFFVLILSKPVQATHIIGGQLTYTGDTTAAPNPLRYFFKLIIYQDGNSAADNPEATLELGDGIKYTSSRTSKIPISNTCGLVFQNTYYFEHTFSGSGRYTALYRDTNRGRNITNLAGSGQQGFAITAEITIDLFAAPNTQHQFLIAPIFCASLNQPFYHSLAAFNPDGDSLVYELVTPLQTAAPSGNPVIQNVTGYRVPDKALLNARTGELSWKNPDQLGSYSFAVRVKRYRDNQFMGSIMRDFLINVTGPEGVNQNFTVENRSELSITDENKIAMTIGQPLVIKIKYETNGRAKRLDAFSELFSKATTYTLDTVSSEGVITATLTLNPAETWRRNQPYFLVFRGTTTSTGPPAQQDFTLALYSNPETINGTGPHSGEPSFQDKELFTVFPNPASLHFRVKSRHPVRYARLLLYNTQSQLVVTQDLTAGITQILLPAVAPGLYVYRIQSEMKQTLQTGKLRIE